MPLNAHTASVLFAIAGAALLLGGLARLTTRRAEQLPPETASALFIALSGVSLLVEAGVQTGGAFGLVGWVMIISAWMASQFGTESKP